MSRFFIVIVLFASVQLCLAQKGEPSHNKSTNGGFSSSTMEMLNPQVDEKGDKPEKKGLGEKRQDQAHREKDGDLPGGERRNNKDPRAVHADESMYTSIERYANYTMRNGWLEGIGKVDEEQARHMSTYYEFSERDREGHWGRVRALNGYGRMQGTYLFYRVFTNLDYDKATWQWDDIPKNTTEIRVNKGIAEGDLVYQYYDASGMELCTGHSRKLDEKSVLMHFSTEDSDTIPLYKDRVAGDCELVYYERNENGYDVYLRFFSRHGGAAVNTDSAFAVRRTYDKVGNRLTDRSLDIVDAPMIDWAGNNGWEATCDAMGKDLTVTNMGVDWKPMVPHTDKPSNQTIRSHHVYDKYSRLSKTYYTDENDNPMADGDGLYAVYYQYNDRGLQTELKLYNVSGEPFEGYGFFRCKIEYDKKGYMTSRKYYNKDATLSENIDQEVFAHDSAGKEIFYECRDSRGRWRNNDKGIAKRVATYNQEGSVLNEDKWCVDSLGNLRLTYYRHENADSIVYYNGEKRDIYLKDARGKTYADYTVNLDGKIIPSGYPKEYFVSVYKRMDEPHKTTFLNVHFDDNNKVIYDPASGWSESWFFVDSVNVTKHWKKFDDAHQVIYNSCEQYSSFTEKSSFSFLLNDYDIPCWRTSRKYVWYKRLVFCNYRGDAILNAYYNDWDEPTYVVRNGRSAYHKIVDAGSYAVSYDEYGNMCNKSDSLYKVLPKAFSIEVTDSIAYRLGIKDNDIILQYGDWQHEMNWTSNLDAGFYVETILKAKENKTLLVLRSDGKERSTCVRQINLPQGRLSDLGINPVLRCLASKENQRLTDCYEAYLSNNPKAIPDTTDHISRQNWVLVCVPRKDGHTTLYSDMRIRSPFILLMQNFYENALDSLAKQENNSKEKGYKCSSKSQWLLEDDRWANRYSELSGGGYKKVMVYYTDDSHSVSQIDSVMDWSTLKDDRSSKWTRVTDNTYQQLVRLRETLRADGSQIRELVHDSIVVDSTVVQCLSPLGIIKEWEKNPEHHVMEQSELVDCLSEIDFDDFKMDSKNVKLDGITVDEDKSPQSVREYNSLLSRLDMRRLGLIERQLDSNGYTYIWGQKGRGSKKYKQLVIYHRNMFMVMRGKFQLKEN